MNDCDTLLDNKNFVYLAQMKQKSCPTARILPPVLNEFGAIVFYEPHDLSILLTPLPPQALSMDHLDSLGTVELCSSLFKELCDLLDSDHEDIVTLSIYLDECGLLDRLGDGFRAFSESQFPSDQTNIASVFELYDTAYKLFEQHEYGQAAALFSLISSLDDIRSFGLIALSACAFHQALYKSGYDLAIAASSTSAPHPRSFLLAGCCALRLNEVKAAKQYLAFASRVARKNEAYRPEQRAAQSQLLMLQFG